ncbi:hypothetical protein [Mycolicibacterium peregrinum]|uniref:hypothetical protein n=1 Tax=Mycolicibacterium peregrinum TaxID=43304 RepID=UPI003AAF3530
MAAKNQIVSGSLDPAQVRAELRAITPYQGREAAEQICRLPRLQQRLYIEELLGSVRECVDARTWRFVEELIFGVANAPVAREHTPDE